MLKIKTSSIEPLNSIFVFLFNDRKLSCIYCCDLIIFHIFKSFNSPSKLVLLAVSSLPRPILTLPVEINLFVIVASPIVVFCTPFI